MRMSWVNIVPRIDVSLAFVTLRFTSADVSIVSGVLMFIWGETNIKTSWENKDLRIGVSLAVVIY